MNLEDELKQLNAYYEICNYTGRLICANLINGITDILRGEQRTVDAHNSTRQELENRISIFYANIEKFL